MDIPYVFIYEKNWENEKVSVWWTGELKAGATRVVAEPIITTPIHEFSRHLPEFQQALVKAGLYPKEATAMLETWKESYFGTTGLKVFWILPRTLTDQILPIKINPEPANLERVIVGRSEIMTPSLEKYWYERIKNHHFLGYETDWNGSGDMFNFSDRFILAYHERVEEMEVDMPQYRDSLPEVAQPLPRGKGHLSVFPNPVDQKLYIALRDEINDNNSVSLRIYNHVGQQVLLNTRLIPASKYRYELDVSGLAPGYYILHVESLEAVFQYRILKE